MTIWDPKELEEIYKRLPMQRDDNNAALVGDFKNQWPYSTVENFVQWAITNHAKFHWIPEPKPVPESGMRLRNGAHLPNITVAEIFEWTEKSTTFVQDEHNSTLVFDYLNANRQSTIHDLASYVTGNKAFHWLQSFEQPKSKGDFTDRLYAAGVAPDPRAGNKREAGSWVSDIKNTIRNDADRIAHRNAVKAAEALTIYLPDGRVSHSKTAEARRKALAELEE